MRLTQVFYSPRKFSKWVKTFAKLMSTGDEVRFNVHKIGSDTWKIEVIE